MTPVYISLVTKPETRPSSWSKVSIKYNVGLKNGSYNLTWINWNYSYFQSEKQTISPHLQMNYQDLHIVSSHKHLGVIILYWLIVKKNYNRLNIMRKSRTFLDRYSLEKIYISFIIVIWDNQKQNLINKLENIQLNAANSNWGEGEGGRWWGPD